ncbi:MAG: molybdopterin molybdotransferase MoeA [Cytophagaceae bacterium]|nr:molybdopterin molybdotransferase MoeA [Cytophagaceae bacterium]
MVSVKEALELILLQSRSFGTEEIFLKDSFGRVLAEDILADRDYPPFNRSAMDGFALRSADLLKFDKLKIIETVYAGSIATKIIRKGECIKIMTGAPVPAGADVVLRKEDATETGEFMVPGIKELKPGANISSQGEDAKKNDLVISKSHMIDGGMMGTLAALGKKQINVFGLPQVGMISTGDEIRQVGEAVLSYQIRDSNSYSLEGFFQLYGIRFKNKNIVSDRKEDLINSFRKIQDNDIIILTGGVSAGDADFVPDVLTELSVRKIFHKVKIKPGKPLWFGITRDNKIVFALPGNPFSVQTAFKIFIEPYLRACFGLKTLQFGRLPIIFDRKKKTSFDEFFPVTLKTNNSLCLDKVAFNGSGDITSTIASSGLGWHPAEQEELKEGDLINFISWKSFF